MTLVGAGCRCLQQTTAAATTTTTKIPTVTTTTMTQQQQQQLIASSSIKNAYAKIFQHFSCFVWFLLLLLLAATTVTTTTTIIITLNVNKATGNNGANCRRSIKKQKKIKRESATKNAQQARRKTRAHCELALIILIGLIIYLSRTCKWH